MDSQERQAAYAKAKRIERIRAGLCIKCGLPNDKKGTSQVCSYCQKKDAEHRKEVRAKWAFEGLCRICGGELPEAFLLEGRRTCPDCLVKLKRKKPKEEIVVAIEDGHCKVCGRETNHGVLCERCEYIENHAGHGSMNSANKRCQELGWDSYHLIHKPNGKWYIEEIKGAGVWQLR